MATCTAPVLSDGQYLECYEDQPAGLDTVISIFPHEDVQTYPTAYSAVAAGEVTEVMAKLRAASAIVMKATKFPKKLPCIMEKNALQIRKRGRVWENELKVQVQNTELNRALIQELAKGKFSVAVREAEGTDPLLLGQSDGVTTGYLCKIADDGVMEEFGTDYGGEKYIEVTFMATPKHAVVYPFAIAYS